jgi:hypothetical protein
MSPSEPPPDAAHRAQLLRLEEDLRHRLGPAAMAAHPLLERVRRHLPALRDALAVLYGHRDARPT